MGLGALPAELPGPAVGSDRRDAAGSGRPACPPAIPAARSACLVASRPRGSIFWSVRKLLMLGLGALPAELPGPAVGSDRRDAAGSGRPACPPAIPAARSAGLGNFNSISYCLATSTTSSTLRLCSCDSSWGLRARLSGPCRRHRIPASTVGFPFAAATIMGSVRPHTGS